MIRLSLIALLLSGTAAFATPQQAQPAPVAMASAVAAPAAATLPSKLQLRPEINLGRDLVTFGDLIPGLAGKAGDEIAEGDEIAGEIDLGAQLQLGLQRCRSRSRDGRGHPDRRGLGLLWRGESGGAGEQQGNQGEADHDAHPP